jgi:hypothetical protein
MKKRLYFLFAILLSVSISTIAQDIQPSELESKIDALVPASVNDSTPGLVVGIVKE